MAEILKVIGLMSGTSLDGVDAALLETDGQEFVRPGPSLIAMPCAPGYATLWMRLAPCRKAGRCRSRSGRPGGI